MLWRWKIWSETFQSNLIATSTRDESANEWSLNSFSQASQSAGSTLAPQCMIREDKSFASCHHYSSNLTESYYRRGKKLKSNKVHLSSRRIRKQFSKVTKLTVKHGRFFSCSSSSGGRPFEQVCLQSLIISSSCITTFVFMALLPFPDADTVARYNLSGNNAFNRDSN